jgi:hypothetical protein
MRLPLRQERKLAAALLTLAGLLTLRETKDQDLAA